MNRVYRGWCFTKLGTRKDKTEEQQYRAQKGGNIIIGSYESIRYEIDMRELERMRNENNN